ncbi:hypothetical protein ACHAQA_007437 [Verticillium albo-atrum]
MTGKILVFGGTGPAGICLLRELLHRNHEVIAFARTPSKIPDDLKTNPHLEIFKGETTNRDALSGCVARASSIISLLGPNTVTGIKPEVFIDFYLLIFDLMREHGVKRIFAMGTITITLDDDKVSIPRRLIAAFMYLLVNKAWQTVMGIKRIFEENTQDIDWTVYRIAAIPGGSDAVSWKTDREDGEVYEGPVAGQGWGFQLKRGLLARWLVDAVEDGKSQWIGKMPAISRLAGSKRRVD